MSRFGRMHNDYLDPSRHEPVIGPIEEAFGAMLEEFEYAAGQLAIYDYDPPTDDKPAVRRAREYKRQQVQEQHDKMISLVANVELRLAHMFKCPGIDTTDQDTGQTFRELLKGSKP